MKKDKKHRRQNKDDSDGGLDEEDFEVINQNKSRLRKLKKNVDEDAE